jgi:hypothetical protein
MLGDDYEIVIKKLFVVFQNILWKK